MHHLIVIFMLNRLIKPYPLSYGGNVLTPCIVLAAKVKLIKINLMIASLGITFMVLDLGVRWSLWVFKVFESYVGQVKCKVDYEFISVSTQWGCFSQHLSCH